MWCGGKRECILSLGTELIHSSGAGKNKEFSLRDPAGNHGYSMKHLVRGDRGQGAEIIWAQ
jgi:hypothetical protein